MSFTQNTKMPLYELLQKPKKVADCGIELEVEGMYLPPNVPHWTAKQEGSLQNGVEYITKPIKADVVQTYVDNLRKYIVEQHGGVIKPSYRCSTHIHYNFLCDNVEDLLGFIVVFTMFEPVLLSLCGNQRDGNLFCISNYDTGDVIDTFERMCKTFSNVRTHGWTYERGKYAALNFGRLIDLGTLEVRSFPLSMEGATVSKWVSWGLAMKDVAIAEPDKTFRSLWKNVRQNPSWYAITIFGTDAMHLPNLNQLVDMGTETAYELTKVLKTWYAKKDDETKQKIKMSSKTAPPLLWSDE